MSTRRRTTARAKWSRSEYLEDSLAQLEAMAAKAEKAKSYTAAVRAKTEAVRIRGELDQLRETERRQEPPTSSDEHRAEILAEVRRLRQGATEAGSYVAAASLLKLERELLAADEEERRRAEQDRLMQADEETLREEAVEIARGLPRAVLEEALAERESGG